MIYKLMRENMIQYYVFLEEGRVHFMSKWLKAIQLQVWRDPCG
jgi:hypothetical protein